MHTAETTKPSIAPEREPQLWGVLAEYGNVDDLLAAAKVVRNAGYTKWDCHTPFPVHGLDGAMGIKKTILPWLVLGAGLTGTTVAILMQWYVNNPGTEFASWFSFIASYPMTFSGKPYWSLSPNIPVAFELTVLFASLCSFFGMFILNGLPKLYHPAFTNGRFKRVTDDAFFIIIERADLKFHADATTELLRSTSPVAIDQVKD